MFGKILIVLLMLTSLIPSMALGGSNLRYLPAFNVLLMIAVYALFCLKERENREHLWAYYKDNKYILITVILYIITIWISSYAAPPLITTTAPRTPQTFSVTYSGANGYADINYVYFLVNQTSSNENGIFVRYIPSTNTLFLLNDAGTDWGVGCSPGVATQLTNNQGTLNCASTSVAVSGANLTVNWSITPKAAFASTTAKNLYMLVVDNIGASAGWTNIGNWKITNNVGIKENVVMITGICAVLFIMHFIFPILIKTREDFLFILKSLFVIGLLNAIFAAVFFIRYKLFNVNYGIVDIIDFSDKFNMLQGLKMPRLLGIFSNPNSLGILIAIIFPASLLLSMEAKKLTTKMMFASCQLLFVFVIISSFSRASILAAAITLILFIILRRRIISDAVRIFMAAFVVLLTSLIIAGTKLDVLRILSITSQDRIDLWDKAIYIFRNNMLYGIGITNITKILPWQLSAHDTYIEIALGFGVISLVSYSVYLIAALLKIKWHKDRNLSIYTLLTFSSFSVLQLFETLIFGGMSIANFYFLIVLISYLSVTSVMGKDCKKRIK